MLFIISLVFHFIIRYLSLIISISVAIITSCVYLVNWYNSKARLQFKTNDDNLSCIAVLPTRRTAEVPDNFWIYPYRIIINEIITNKSSEPISIINFKVLNTDFLRMSKYVKPGNYKATISTHDGQKNTYINDVKNDYYKLPLNLKPYESVQSNIIFAAKDDKDIDVGRLYKITVETSRKTFTFTVTMKKFIKTEENFPIEFNPNILSTKVSPFEELDKQ